VYFIAAMTSDPVAYVMGALIPSVLLAPFVYWMSGEIIYRGPTALRRANTAGKKSRSRQRSVAIVAGVWGFSLPLTAGAEQPRNLSHSYCANGRSKLVVANQCVLYAGAIGAAYSQQESLSPDQKRDIEAMAMKYFEDINAGEAEKAASIFKSDGMLVALAGRIVRGQAVREYLVMVQQLGAHAVVNVENVEGVANGRAAILTGGFTATFTNAPEVRGTLVQVYEDVGVSWKLRASVGSRFASPPLSPSNSKK